MGDAGQVAVVVGGRPGDRAGGLGAVAPVGVEAYHGLRVRQCVAVGFAEVAFGLDSLEVAALQGDLERLDGRARAGVDGQDAVPGGGLAVGVVRGDDVAPLVRVERGGGVAGVAAAVAVGAAVVVLRGEAELAGRAGRRGRGRGGRRRAPGEPDRADEEGDEKPGSPVVLGHGWAPSYPTGGPPYPAGRRRPRTQNAIPAATPTLSESTPPRIGMPATTSAAASVSSDRPGPSAPNSRATRSPCSSSSSGTAPGPGESATSRNPAARRGARPPGSRGIQAQGKAYPSPMATREVRR